MKNIILISSLSFVMAAYPMDKENKDDWYTEKQKSYKEFVQRLKDDKEREKMTAIFRDCVIRNHFFLQQSTFKRVYDTFCQTRDLNEGQKTFCQSYKAAAHARSPEEVLTIFKDNNCTSNQCRAEHAAFSLQVAQAELPAVKKLQNVRDTLCAQDDLTEGEQVACAYINRFKYVDTTSKQMRTVPTIEQLCQAKSDCKKCITDCKWFIEKMHERMKSSN